MRHDGPPQSEALQYPLADATDSDVLIWARLARQRAQQRDEQRIHNRWGRPWP